LLASSYIFVIFPNRVMQPRCKTARAVLCPVYSLSAKLIRRQSKTITHS